MTIEATLLAILREQRETNDMLRRLLAERAQAHPLGAPAMLEEYRRAVPTLPRIPAVTGDPPHAFTGTTCESPATLGDAGAIRVGWQGNGMVGP